MADFTPSTIELAKDGLKSSSFLPSSSTSHLLLPLVFAVFLLPICHVCPHHCCCLELVAGVSSSVQTVSPSPSFSRNLLVSQTPLRFSVMSCPVALTPKYTPSSHMHVSFSCGPSRPLFPKFSSANFVCALHLRGCSKKALRRDFPHYGQPGNFVSRNPACTAVHGQLECVAAIFYLCSTSLRIVLIGPCTDWTALSTILLLFELPLLIILIALHKGSSLTVGIIV